MIRYKLNVRVIFPVRYADSKRALAVQGSGADFRRSMVDSYRNLTAHMPENGLQVVMFTHQDASIWADLTLILWAAGLRVTGAWTVGTETPFGVKEGNYVQGTVLMVLRKQTSTETAFLHEVVPDVDASNFLVPPGFRTTTGRARSPWPSCCVTSPPSTSTTGARTRPPPVSPAPWRTIMSEVRAVVAGGQG